MDKIRAVQVIPLIRRLDRVFSGSTYQIVSRNTIYARIETEGGIVGEAFGGTRTSTSRRWSRSPMIVWRPG